MRKALLAATVMMIVATGSFAQTTLKANFGWGGAFRTGRWNPIYVNLADQQVRSVILHVHGQYAFGAGLDIQQRVAAQPFSTLFCLLYPVNADPSKIAVIATDEATGKTLAAQLPQNPANFSPAGHTPLRLLAADDRFVAIAGDISASLRISEQLNQAAVANGVLLEDHLPAWAMGFEGINVLILASPDLHGLDEAQKRALMNWIEAGGNLLLIPGTDDLPPDDLLMGILPCDIGVNTSVALPTTQQSLNARTVAPRADAQEAKMGQWTGCTVRRGLGRVSVLPVDVSPMKFDDARDSVMFWRSALAGEMSVPDLKTITEMTISNELDAAPPTGATAADSVGRGVEETRAIRGLLATLDADHPHGTGASAATLLALAVLGFVLGPMDSVLLMRLGQSPRHWLTVTGWLVFLACTGGFAVVKIPSPQVRVHNFRLIDQVDRAVVARADLVALESNRTARITPEFPEDEWWEPANQSSAGFSEDRFFDAVCHEDQNGCEPVALSLTAGEAQAFRGESLMPGIAMLDADLAVHGSHLTGKLTNRFNSEMTQVTIVTKAGSCKLDGALAAGATVNVDQILSPDIPAPTDLPPDYDQISPDRTRHIADLLQTGDWASITCRLPSSPGPKFVEGAVSRNDTTVLRVTQKLGNE